MVATQFTDIHRRVRRAYAHAIAFRDEWESLLSPDSFEMRVEMNADCSGGIVRAVAKKPPQYDLDLTLGEFFYQLRAALDGAMYIVAATVSKNSRPKNENRIEFPIYADESQFQKKTRFIPVELRTWLESIQPYNAHRTAENAHALLNEQLRILHDCARTDRHRRLHVVAAYPVDVAYNLVPLGTGRITSCKPISCNFLDGDCVLLRFTSEYCLSADDIKLAVSTEVNLEVNVPEIPLPPHATLADALKMFIRATKFVVAYLEAWCRAHASIE